MTVSRDLILGRLLLVYATGQRQQLLIGGPDQIVLACRVAVNREAIQAVCHAFCLKIIYAYLYS